MPELAPGATPVGQVFTLPNLRLALFGAVLRADVRALAWLQAARARLPRALRRALDKLVSAHPLYDLTLALWLCVPWALAALGWRLFWALALNVLGGFLATWLVGGPRPGDLIDWLRPRARLSPAGFPCIELQVGACLLTYTAWWYGAAAPALAALCAAAGAAVLASRLYALTHFPHQLALSAAIGAASVPGCRRLGRYLFAMPVPQEVHLLGAFCVGCLCLGYVCYYAETNQVPFARVPRAEFTRVMQGILERSEQVPERAPRAAARWGGAGSSGGGGSSSSDGDTARSAASAGRASGGELRQRGGGSRGASYPPVGPGGAGGGGGSGGGGGGGASFPPAGPQAAAAAAPALGLGLGLGLNLGGAPALPRRDRPAPRDSLYHLLKAASR